LAQIIGAKLSLESNANSQAIAELGRLQAVLG
jgi:hypothetical protein